MHTNALLQIAADQALNNQMQMLRDAGADLTTDSLATLCTRRATQQGVKSLPVPTHTSNPRTHKIVALYPLLLSIEGFQGVTNITNGILHSYSRNPSLVAQFNQQVMALNGVVNLAITPAPHRVHTASAAVGTVGQPGYVAAIPEVQQGDYGAVHPALSLLTALEPLLTVMMDQLNYLDLKEHEGQNLSPLQVQMLVVKGADLNLTDAQRRIAQQHVAAARQMNRGGLRGGYGRGYPPYGARGQDRGARRGGDRGGRGRGGDRGRGFGANVDQTTGLP